MRGRGGVAKRERNDPLSSGAIIHFVLLELWLRHSIFQVRNTGGKKNKKQLSCTEWRRCLDPLARHRPLAVLSCWGWGLGGKTAPLTGVFDGTGFPSRSRCFTFSLCIIF